MSDRIPTLLLLLGGAFALWALIVLAFLNPGTALLVGGTVAMLYAAVGPERDDQ